jgi:hypothetical protein
VPRRHQWRRGRARAQGKVLHAWAGVGEGDDEGGHGGTGYRVPHRDFEVYMVVGLALKTRADVMPPSDDRFRRELWRPFRALVSAGAQNPRASARGNRRTAPSGPDGATADKPEACGAWSSWSGATRGSRPWLALCRPCGPEQQTLRGVPGATADGRGARPTRNGSEDGSMPFVGGGGL